MEFCIATFNDGTTYGFSIDTREGITQQAKEEEAKAMAAKDTFNSSGVARIVIAPCRRLKPRRAGDK